MTNEAIIRTYREMEAVADLLIEKAYQVKRSCHLAVVRLAGVSTPAPKRACNAKIVADAIAKRNARMAKKINSKP